MSTITPEQSQDQARLESRALAAYYRAGGRVHPEHSLTGHYVLDSKPIILDDGSKVVKGISYIRLANSSGTLAVFSVNDWDELRRLKRWPQSIESGTARTEAQFNTEIDEILNQPVNRSSGSNDDEAESILNELDGVIYDT
ncbi:hypothetical protein [Methylobacterium sp. CM6257]